MEENRIAVIAIIVENPESVRELNEILHEYSSIIIGRMGIPYREKKVSLISIAVDSDSNTINAMTGRLGKLDGVTVKAAYSKK
ncbi:MAG: iron-only hydrogenase system regulator [Solobacterium sp.]|nr:iron-only hydrogenase system regulator [Solobacterium sp.]